MLHSEIQDSIPLLALGGLEEQEQARLEQHLAVCPSCRALASEYAFVAQELDMQVPPQNLPPNLEAKLLQQLSHSNRNAVHKPARDATTTPKRNFWRQPVQISRWAFALGAIVLLLLLGGATALGFQMQQLGSQAAPAASRGNTLENLKFVSLTSAPGGPDGYICLAPDNKTAMLWLTKMDAVDMDHAYQLWLIKDGQRISGGLFRPGNDGRAIVLVNAQEPWGNYQEVGVTIEPKGGSLKPTTPRVIGGKLD